MEHLSHYNNYLFESSENIEDLIKKIQAVLTDDLLTPYWKDIIKKEDNHPTAGHCYAASEALYHLIDGQKSRYTPHVGRTEDGTHWWLQNKRNKILDPTIEQFYYKEKLPPYNNGRGTGFLTKSPSKRAQIIINRVNSLT